MANKILDWSLFGSYGTGVHSGMSVDTGGIAVSVDFNAQDYGATATTDSEAQYAASGETFDSSSLKLYGQGGEGGVDNTSTTTLNFSSTNTLYDDEVSNVSFRINDLDVGTYSDNHQDIVTIRAYDADGNLVPATLSTTGGATISGSTAYAHDVDNGTIQADDATGSILVEIAGPVAKIEIDYDNGDCTDQAIWVTDVHFETISVDLRDGYVEGTDSGDDIDVAYTGDPDGDKIDNGDAILAGEAAQDDIVLAYDGDDTVTAGAGDDDVYAGAGNDSVDGGTGNDILLGDQNIEGAGTGGTAPTGEYVRETFEWDQAPDTNGPGTIEGGDPLAGFTQNTGNVDVTFGIVSTHETPETEFADNQQKVHSIDTGTETINAYSSLASELNSNNESATYSWDFSNPVENLEFRINDIDNDSKVTIKAYDADGNLINLDGAEGSCLVETEVNHVYTVEPKYDNQNAYDTSPEYSDLISVVGPVARLEITHEQNGYDSSAINITDMYFDAPVMGDVPADCNAGNDTLNGEEGDDLIAGQGGADSLTGGDGNDTIYGGSIDTGVTTANLIVNGSFEDTTGMTTTSYGYVGDGAIPGWTEDTGEEIDVHNDDRGGLEPTDGDNWLDLAATPGNSTVGQDVHGAIDGETYTLTFDTGDLCDSKDGTIYDNQVQVIWGGEVVATINPVDGAMSSYEFTVVGGAGDGSDRLEFAGLGYADNYGASIDNVQLVGPTAAGECGEDTGDTIVGGTGADMLYGQQGDDLFTVGSVAEGAGDVVVGGNGPDETLDNDVLDLRGTGQVTIDDSADSADQGATAGTVTFADGSVLTFSQIETILTDPQNEAPTAVDDAVTVEEDGSITFNPILNDVDPDGDMLSVAGFTQPDHGTLAQNPDGTFTYTPDPDYNGIDSFTYTVTDPSGETSTATVNLTVTPLNDAPVANDDADMTPYNTAVTIPVLANDTDVDGDTLTVTAATSPDGSVDINPGGTITFTPADGFEGTATINYTITDSNGGFDDAVVTVTVEESPLDGIVEGTTGNDVIDVAYTGDPEGDMVDNDDALLPGEVGEDDIIEAYEGNDYVDAGLGNDEIDAGSGDDTVYGREGDDIVEAGEGNDSVRGNEGSDTLLGGDGMDTLRGGEDDDTVDGGIGDDLLYGGTGDDSVDGGDGADEIFGNEGNDTINGGEGDDYINSRAGEAINDYETFVGFPVDGSPDDDRDLVDGGAGNDTILTGDDADTIYGGIGDDSIDSGIDADEVYGGAGQDYIDANLGSDYVDGGDGDDTIIAGIDAFSDYVGDDPNLPNGLLIDPATGLPALSDPNTEDGKDTVIGGAGNDYIVTGDDADSIEGGADNDTIDAGIDDDYVDGGTGHDSIIGGHGSDTIYGQDGDDWINAGDSTLLWGQEDDKTDPVPENGLDYVDGGAGNDTIFGEDDDDTLLGGTGDDLIDGGLDEDSIDGGDGFDTLLGGDGKDTINGGLSNDSIDGGRNADELYGGDGNDTLLGGNGEDTLMGGAGNDLLDGGTGGDVMDGGIGDDTIIGSSGRDTIDGGDGNDSIVSGLGEDLVHGGMGDDTIEVGAENDTIYGDEGNDLLTGFNGVDEIYGGDDRDTIIGGTAGDSIDGGAGGDDFDTLDLRGSAPSDGSLQVTFTGPDSNGNGYDGVVTYYDSAGNETGSFDFSEIEEVIPCFTPGTTIATPKGERLVEELQVGDRVITRDNGLQEIRWIGQKGLTGVQLQRNAHLKPILITRGALGNGLPERDMLVSPNHRVLVNNEKTALYFEEREVLAAAKHLVGAEGIHEVDVMGTTYIHFMFDHHEVVLSNGSWTESFQPGDYTLQGIGNAQRNEIFELFPELKAQGGVQDYQSARRALKKHEAKLLIK